MWNCLQTWEGNIEAKSYPGGGGVNVSREKDQINPTVFNV
jgi:hypothetical protein